VVKKEAEKKEANLVREETNKFQLSEFVGETKEELAKVVWPSRQQLISESLAVILMVALVATIIYLVDKFFVWGAARLFQ
jgi:preprotein translocase subunit SecE